MRPEAAKFDSELLEGIEDYRRIIAFRNSQIHGYAAVDDALVWDTVQRN